MGHDHFALATNLILFFLVCTDSAYSQAHYYIRSSLNVHCPGNPCLTLAQFVADSASYLSNETNISLFILPGNHSLDRELSLSHADNFSMTKNTGGSGTVFVECGSQSGRFNISDITFAAIKGLHFIGCGGNIVSNVEQFIIEDTIFQGMQKGKGTALVLNKVSNTSIGQSYFLSNTILQYSNFTRNQNYFYLTGNISLADAGALHAVFSNVLIVNTTFTHNSAEFGGALLAHNSSLRIIGSTYSYNYANFGGVIATSDSSVDIDNSTFSLNTANISGGVMTTFRDSIRIYGAVFTNNIAGEDSGVMMMEESSFSIARSTFSGNTAGKSAGVIFASNCAFSIIQCTCTNNAASFNSFMLADNSWFTITNSTFANNSDIVVYILFSSFNIVNSIFTDNILRGGFGAIMFVFNSSFNFTNSAITSNSAPNYFLEVMTIVQSSFSITNGAFTNNSADFLEFIYTYDSSFHITTCTFANNRVGSIFITSNSSFHITNSTFANNNATYGSVIYATNSLFNIDSTSFYANKAGHYLRGTMFAKGCTTHISNTNFDFNVGSLYFFNSNLTFSGYTTFEYFAEPSSEAATLTRQEGGAITSFRSTVTFNGVTNLSNNQARRGGAIMATDSKIMMYGETKVINNTATSGAGISLYKSDLEVKGNCTISHNRAILWGGGIQATSSTLAVYQSGTLQFINNSAEFGGGLYLEFNTNLYILKTDISYYYNDEDYLLLFGNNHAVYGGAVYVADDTIVNACAPDNECFIQTFTLSFYQTEYFSYLTLFSDNTASEQGANIFGGLLDRCIPSPFVEEYQVTYYNGISYLGYMSNLTDLDTVSSLPVRICFCKSDSEPDCSHQPPIIEVKKGESFTVALVAVDQVNHSVDANIIIFLSSLEGGLREGQQIQRAGNQCTSLTFNVFTPNNFETLNIFADGPCGSFILSTRHLDIQFLDCTCLIGFERSSSVTRCECTCDSELFPYITSCNTTTESLTRIGTNSWVTYIMTIDPPGYVIHPNCPFDYCKSPLENVSINLNLPNGADAQCAYNRSGVLCGACQEHLSLSLGSSHCLPCLSHWPVVLVVILLAAIIAGILLVTALLVLNMTVAVGLINGFIFYANIVAVNSAVFFPSSEPSFPTVFIAWLNLDIGIDACFINGLDAYTKTWLQLVFPVYIISLMIVVIIVKEYSSRFARLIRKTDPVSTLATLILLSYSKLLSVGITALSSTALLYPDGSQETVWLPDGNVKYFHGKHIPLSIVALMIILIEVPYAILLFLWQWLVRAPKWKVFKWMRNTKLNAFVSIHNVPYNSKYHYWTGLLLLVRMVLFITVSATELYQPQISLLVTIILVGGLLSLTNIAGVSVYKNLFIGIIGTVLNFNLLVASALSWHNFKTDIRKQTAVSYISTIITLLLLIGAIVYHVFLLIRKDKPQEEADEHSLVSPDSEMENVTNAKPVNPCDPSTLHNDNGL